MGVEAFPPLFKNNVTTTFRLFPPLVEEYQQWRPLDFNVCWFVDTWLSTNWQTWGTWKCQVGTTICTQRVRTICTQRVRTIRSHRVWSLWVDDFFLKNEALENFHNWNPKGGWRFYCNTLPKTNSKRHAPENGWLEDDPPSWSTSKKSKKNGGFCQGQQKLHRRRRRRWILMKGGGNSNILIIFIPKIGEDSHCDEHIFQVGWNHQLVDCFVCFFDKPTCCWRHFLPTKNTQDRMSNVTSVFLRF